MKIYFAAPLFSEADRDWIRSTIKKIEDLSRDRGVQVGIVFPYDLITQEEIDSLGSAAKFEIFSRCQSHLDDAEVVIAVLDGCMIDDGTEWEIGYFYKGKSESAKIIGVPTDFRNAGESAGAVVVEMGDGKILLFTTQYNQHANAFITE
jgi:nucleoside 2-deoxyribosyltransferase